MHNTNPYFHDHINGKCKCMTGKVRRWQSTSYTGAFDVIFKKDSLTHKLAGLRRVGQTGQGNVRKM
jgi:hypothetical protein